MPFTIRDIAETLFYLKVDNLILGGTSRFCVAPCELPIVCVIFRLTEDGSIFSVDCMDKCSSLECGKERQSSAFREILDPSRLLKYQSLSPLEVEPGPLDRYRYLVWSKVSSEWALEAFKSPSSVSSYRCFGQPSGYFPSNLILIN